MRKPIKKSEGYNVKVKVKVWTYSKQDSKELSPRPLANAPKRFYSKKTL